MSLNDLVSYLSSADLSPKAEALQQHIGSSGKPGPCVYFAAPYQRLRLIFESGYLLPHNATRGLDCGPELSATGVQARRREVFLGDGFRPHPPRLTHNCLNFFFNPDNTTLDAFARNQLIQNGLPIQLGILEFPLQRIADFLSGAGGLWACSRKNVAKGGYLSSLPDELSDNNWPWEDILDMTKKLSCRDARAGEFLLWLKGGEGNCSSGLPVSLASRLLRSPQCTFDHSPEIPVSKYKQLRPIEKLLEAERYLEKWIRFSPLSPKLALKTFEDAVEALPIKLTAKAFANEDLALSDEHGLPHVTRVMFWTHFLTAARAQLLPGAKDDNFLGLDTLFAALIHDLRRPSDEEDEQHGQAAAKHFSGEIADFCDNDQSRIKRIKQAVTWHCRADENCPDQTDPVFLVLKDANALDRGRFFGPCDATDFAGSECVMERCHHKGCSYKTLRLAYEKLPARYSEWPVRKNLTMAAWNIARSTYTAPWPEKETAGFLVHWLNSAMARLEAARVPERCP